MIMKRVSLVSSVASIMVLCAAEAAACPICVPYPETTLADVLMESESIIMVRESDENPYVFTPVGSLKGTSLSDDFDGFLDSSSRRRLRQNPDDVAVLVRNTPEDPWGYRAYATPEIQEFLRAILEQSTQWTGPEGSARRVAFFTDRLTHTDDLIRKQAYLEVGRAPYSVIKTIAAAVPRHQILEFLANWRLIEWHSLFILMLGQSELSGDHDRIRSQLERYARFGITTNLSAWATAYIEINPGDGIGEIEALYFATGRRTPEEIEEIHRSLSVLGSEGGAVPDPRVAQRRRRIVQSYGTLLGNHPAMAGYVAKDLTNWRTQALVDQLSGIMESETVLDPGSKMAVDYYLSMAPRFRSTLPHR